MRRGQPWWRISAALYGSLLLAASGASLATSEEPTVIGFERFARHEMIGARTAGELLLTELNCTSCHPAADPLEPKLGPLLSGVGSRIQREWLRAFLLNPAGAKPGTTMPDLLHEFSPAKKRDAVSALVAFLSDQRASFPELKASGLRPIPHAFWTKGNPDRGRELYHEIGCVACHQPDPDYPVSGTDRKPLETLLEGLEPEEIEAMGLADATQEVPSIDHPNLSAKYTLQALTYFLYDPTAVRPSSRMPDFQLSAMEAADLAAYLMKRSEPTEFPQPVTEVAIASTDLVARGRQLFERLGCQSCHQTEDALNREKVTPLDQLDVDAVHSCIARPNKEQPAYRLDSAQAGALRSAIRAYAEHSPRTSTAAPHFELLQLNCYACHERDELGGVGPSRGRYMESVGNVDLGDEGRLPPPLSGVGRKLNPGAIRSVLRGTLRLRPHMHLRMPRYSSATSNDFAKAFRHADRRIPPPRVADVFAATKAKGFSQDELAEAGRRLMDIGCVQCHSFRGHALPGVMGVDLAAIDQRIEPDWFRQFLLDPASLKPRTRMPTFFPDGKSQTQEVLDGDVSAQLLAIWTYLSQLDRRPLPEKIESARLQDYELKPEARPVILRTFMPVAGTHAIAVGFPAGVHFAFDAEQARPAVVWKGRFLDAQGTWFSRFAPPAPPLGRDITQLPTGPVFWNLDEDGAVTSHQPAPASFGGYRLDPSGTPTFLYRWADFQIEDCIRPGDKDTLVRQLEVHCLKHERASANAIALRVAPAHAKQLPERSEVRLKSGLTVRVRGMGAEELEVVRIGDTNGWFVAFVPGADNIAVELEYQW